MFIFEKTISSFNRHQYARERDQKIIEKMKRENMAVNDISERYKNFAEDERQSLVEYRRN